MCHRPLVGKTNAKVKMVHHSKATKIIAYICAAILLPVYSLGPVSMIYLSSKRIGDGDWQTLLFLACICIALTYWGGRYFWLMLRFLGTLRFSFTFDATGIVLQSNNDSTFYPWNALAKSKEYGSCQIYCLITSDNRHLFSIWEYAENYKAFREEAMRHGI